MVSRTEAAVGVAWRDLLTQLVSRTARWTLARSAPTRVPALLELRPARAPSRGHKVITGGRLKALVVTVDLAHRDGCPVDDPLSDTPGPSLVLSVSNAGGSSVEAINVASAAS